MIAGLSSRRSALLPGAAALGGMLIPAVFYLAIAGTTAPPGWAIPTATDVAPPTVYSPLPQPYLRFVTNVPTRAYHCR